MGIRFVLLAVLGLAGAPAQFLPGRYLVELQGEPAGRAPKARLRGEQTAMRERLSRHGVKVLGQTETVANLMFVEAAGVSAEELAALPGVRRVHRSRRFRLSLDRAVGVHHVPAVWSQTGEDRADAGIKIGILDTGIDHGHPGFQEALPALPGFPKGNNELDLAFTNAKVIAARSYVHLLPGRDGDLSPRDRVGHGTALGMIAAGARHEGSRGTLTGVAPRAYLGNYKIFGSPRENDTTSEEAILKAIDDAVNDGMDVLNLSFGTALGVRLEIDPVVQAIERAVAAGVVVVVAAGNDGPDY
jgi:hypothetical protein